MNRLHRLIFNHQFRKISNAVMWTMMAMVHFLIAHVAVLYISVAALASCCEAWVPISNIQPSSSRLWSSRERRTIRLENGDETALRSRDIAIRSDWNITVWEWEKPASVVEAYWNAQSRNLGSLLGGGFAGSSNNNEILLDPFGLVSWPGSLVAARELSRVHPSLEGKTVLVIGAGVGLEAQAAAHLGATKVIATDIHPTTLKQCSFGAEYAGVSDRVETRILDLFSTSQNLPKADIVIAADVLYNERLAHQVCLRCAEIYQQYPNTQVLISDSQGFVSHFMEDLNNQLRKSQKDLYRQVEWKEETLKSFKGSGVAIDEDQVYDVKVRSVWVGLDWKNDSVFQGIWLSHESTKIV